MCINKTHKYIQHEPLQCNRGGRGGFLPAVGNGPGCLLMAVWPQPGQPAAWAAAPSARTLARARNPMSPSRPAQHTALYAITAHLEGALPLFNASFFHSGTTVNSIY